jgi:hypothetical protein
MVNQKDLGLSWLHQTNYGLAIYIKKYLKAKEEELWKTQIFSACKNILIFKKIL